MPNTMRDRFRDTLSAHRNELLSILSKYVAWGKGMLQSRHLIDELIKSVKEDEATLKLRDSHFFKVLESAQEAIVLPSFVAIAIRPRPGV
ncbi:hypothetical protein CRYUN_Cryun27aG0003300 [Craigia yunnanensis]